MGLDIIRLTFENIEFEPRGYDLLECLEDYGARQDRMPVLRMSKQEFLAASQDEKYGAVIAKAFGPDFANVDDNDDDDVVFHLWF